MVSDWLKRVNINTLSVYQQCVLYFISMVTTSIFVTSCVVFVRLYRAPQHAVDNYKTNLKCLARILVGYYISFHVLGPLCLIPWIRRNVGYQDHLEALGINPTWCAVFTSQSMFNYVGFTLTPNSIFAFQHVTSVLLTMSFLIVIGNTGFPCLLRLILWVASQAFPDQLSFQNLLKNPRGFFTHLFPKSTTWALFGILVGLNTLDVVLFVALDINNATIRSLPVGNRIMGALFQSVSSRT